MVFVLRVLLSKGCCFAVEQPTSSLMFEHPDFEVLFKQYALTVVSSDLSDFGASSQKPVKTPAKLLASSCIAMAHCECAFSCLLFASGCS